MNLLTQNKKLKDTSKAIGKKVFNFSLPAYKFANGKKDKNGNDLFNVVCPFAGSCIKPCYAQKGNYTRYPKNNLLREQKYYLTKSDNFVDLMSEEIKKKKANYIRVHDSGDFYSRQYALKWFKIAELNPEVKFYAYTKSFKWFMNMEIPNNFDLIFSEGSINDNLIDTKLHRHARIFDTENDLLEAGYINASKNDLMATKFFNTSNKVGLIFH